MKYTIIVVCLSSLFSCNSSKQSTKEEPKPNTVNQAAPPATIINNDQQEVAALNKDTMPKPKAFVYRFIVSFISIGEGTDLNAKKMLDEHLVQWRNKSAREIHYEEVPWGREGEVDFCFPLIELNQSQQTQFISELKSKYNNNRLVELAENEACPHKR